MLRKFIITALLFCLAAVCQCFASAENEGDWEYSVYKGDFAYITGYNGNSAVVDIPRSLGGVTVTEVYINCFDGHDEVKTVNFHEWIDNIYVDDSEEFTLGIENYNVSEDNKYYCSLDGVIFDKDIARIVLYPCKKTDKSYSIPDTVANISARAFYKSVFLNELKLPSSLSNIQSKAFEGCDSLSSVTLPAGFEIGFLMDFSGAFDDCSGLSDIFVEEGSIYRSVDGVLCDAAEETLIKYPPGRNDETYTVPDTVLTIESGAFSGSKYLKEIIIPDTVTEIGAFAFQYCDKLEKVRLPEELYTIGSNTFFGCKSLKSVDIPQNVRWIDIFAFADSGIEEIYISDGVASISAGAFSGCKALEEFNVSDENTTYHTVDGILFDELSLISYPAGKQGEKYQIPEDVSSISAYAFGGCENLQEVTLNDNITVIPSCCFENCVNMTKLNNTGSVTAVEDSAFENTAIVNNSKDDIIYIDDIAVSSSEDITEANIKDGTRLMADSLFSYRSKLQYVHIPEGITAISRGAFSGCYDLERAELPDGLTEIGSTAFMFCSSLRSIYLPESVVTIGAYAFDWCSALTSVNIPKNVTEINSGTFEGCRSLETIALPDNIKTIGFYAFSRCRSLRSIELPQELETIDGGAFFDCDGLSTVEIPENVTVISNYAFSSCDSLRNVFFYDGITEIQDNVFEYCQMLKDVFYEGTEKQWKKVIIGEGNEILTGAEFHPDSTALDAWSAQLPDSTSMSVVTRNDGIRNGNILSMIIGIPSVIMLVIGLTLMVIRKIKNRRKPKAP